MHNFTLALNPTISQLRTNVEIIERAANDDMYRVWVPPIVLEDAGLAGTATYTKYAATPIPAHWTLPDAVTSGITFLLPRHPQWVNGLFYVTVLYSVSGTSAGNIAWRVRQFSYEEGTAFTAESGTAQGQPAPTTANTLHKLDLDKSDTSIGYFSVLNEYIAQQISIERLGGAAADTSTDDVRIHAVIVNYLEARRSL